MQVNQHQPPVYVLSGTIKRLSIRHQSGKRRAPFNAEKDLRMDVVIERGGLRDVTWPEYTANEAIPLDVNQHADPLEEVHIRTGRADRDG